MFLLLHLIEFKFIFLLLKIVWCQPAVQLSQEEIKQNIFENFCIYFLKNIDCLHFNVGRGFTCVFKRLSLIVFYFINNSQQSLETDGKKEMFESYTDQQIEDTIDQVLNMMDKNNDGQIEYYEYKFSGVAENRKDDFPNKN